MQSCTTAQIVISLQRWRDNKSFIPLIPHRLRWAACSPAERSSRPDKTAQFWGGSDTNWLLIPLSVDIPLPNWSSLSQCPVWFLLTKGPLPPRLSKAACSGGGLPADGLSGPGCTQGWGGPSLNELPCGSGLCRSDSTPGPASDWPAPCSTLSHSTFLLPPEASGMTDWQVFQGDAVRKTFYICEMPPPCHVLHSRPIVIPSAGGRMARVEQSPEMGMDSRTSQ